jgi:hypothetical protein
VYMACVPLVTSFAVAQHTYGNHNYQFDLGAMLALYQIGLVPVFRQS